MKLIVLRSNLLDALSYVEKGVGGDSSLPILKNVLLKTEGNKIVMVGTNLELAITSTFSGKIIENGETTIPFSVFFSIVKNLNAERISIELKNKKIIITTDNYEASIQGQEAKEFPIIPSLHNSAQAIKINTHAFIEALQKTVVAAQYSEIRPEISGILFRVEDSFICVATDGFRLTEKKIDQNQIETQSKEAVRVIVPLRTIEEMLRILPALEKQEEFIEIFIDPTQILFKTQTVQAVSRLIDGNFPEYEPIIPKNTEMEIVVSRSELINALKLTSSFSGRANDISFILGENKKHIELYSGDASLGEGRYKVSARIKGDGASSLTFNWRYFLDGLKVFDSEEVTIGINAPDKPVVIKTQEEPLLIYIVMPIKN